MITWIILFSSLAGILIGADMLVNGAVKIANKLRLSGFVIGAAVIGVGTSMPELVVSLMGAVDGNADIAVGNVIGSNICNILLILGITAMISPIEIERKNLKFELPVCIGLSVLLFLFAYDPLSGNARTIRRLDGLVMLCCTAIYMYISFRQGRVEEQSECKAVPTESSSSIAVLQIIIGLSALIAGSHFFVKEAALLARQFGVSDAFISITMLAVGTSLPELAASIASVLKKNTQMALGNIVGSNIFNIGVVIGLCAQASPLLSKGITIIDYCTMVFAAIILVLAALRKRISRTGGIFMLLIYALYVFCIAKN